MSDEELRKELSDARAECSRLRRENARLRVLLERFDIRFGAKSSRTSDTTPTASAVNTTQQHQSSKVPSRHEEVVRQRIALFRSLFRGREDVYAKRWESQKGAVGYSPACANEWDALLCNKPCSKCGNAKYLSLTDDAVKRHLLGEITIGLYPLLPDETCWFLAADFDGGGWQEAAQAFLETCMSLEAAAYLERSRSGNGGHIWFFFEEAIPASLARKLGAAILTRSMEACRHIGFASYDRFFPNQDTMPRGGFGNLIALPLQAKPRKKGNSVFLDAAMQPYEKQWEFLGGVERISSSQIESIVVNASRRGTILGVRRPEVGGDSEEDPWTLPPSRKRKGETLSGPLPDSLSIVRSNMLFIEKSELSPALMNRLVRLAAFQNPEFYAAQAMRLSTYGKPRIISCAEEFPKHLALPRGCLDDLSRFLEAHSIAVHFEDKRFAGENVTLTFHGTLAKEQERVVKKLTRFDEAVLAAPTGFGKTVLAAWIIAERATNTLVLVHQTSLLEQWREQLASFLNIPLKEIGVIGGGRKRPSGRIDIAMTQSLNRKGEVNDLIAEYGQIIVDECHHISAFTFERVLREAKAKYVLGLTATPLRKDGHHPIIYMQCGPLREKIHSQSAAAQRPFEHVLKLRPTSFELQTADEKPPIQEVYAGLIMDEHRNEEIVKDIVDAIAEGRQCLVLTERVAHLEGLHEILQPKVERCILLYGGLGKKAYREAIENLRSTESPPACVIATGRFIGEGFDYAPLDTLFLTMPISWRGALQQYIGRLHRNYANKHEVRVYDYVDHKVPVLARMFQKRMRGYTAFGYSTDNQMLLPDIDIPQGAE